MAVDRLESSRFPYLPLSLRVGDVTLLLEALVDSGFDGDVAIPGELLGSEAPDVYQRWSVADGRIVEAPVYHGLVRLGSFGPLPITVLALGLEVIMGRRIIEHYTVIFDHGQRVVVEL